LREAPLRIARSTVGEAGPVPDAPFTSRRRNSIRFFLFALPVLLSPLADRMLALFNVPREFAPQTAHPPNYNEVRRNIEFIEEFRTNSQGLRYREIPLRKPAATRRIFVVGDSTIEGWGVREEETVSSLLEGAMSDGKSTTNFINGGLAGTGPLQYGRIFLDVGVKYEPDGLLIAISVNDVSNTSVETTAADLYAGKSSQQRSGVKALLHNLWPRTYTLLYQVRAAYDYSRRHKVGDFARTISDEARQRGISKERIEAWKAALPADLVAAVNRSEFNGALLGYGLLEPAYLTDQLDIDTDRARAKWNAMAAVLSDIVKAARSLGIEVAVVYLPHDMQFDASLYDGRRRNPYSESGFTLKREWLEGRSELQRRLAQWSQQTSAPFLDLTPTFRKAAEVTPALAYPLDSHWTAAGHRLAAEAIAKWLKEDRVFSFIR